VLDFKDFDPTTASLSSGMLLAIGHIEGLTIDNGWGGALKGPLVIKNTSTDRHCYATVITNGWQATGFYRFFLSSKNQPLVEVRRLSDFAYPLGRRIN
jgi:hypothetical protein